MAWYYSSWMKSMSLIFVLSSTEDYARGKKFNAASNFLESYLINHKLCSCYKKKKFVRPCVCVCVCVSVSVSVSVCEWVGGWVVLSFARVRARTRRRKLICSVYGHMHTVSTCVMLRAEVQRVHLKKKKKKSWQTSWFEKQASSN